MLRPLRGIGVRIALLSRCGGHAVLLPAMTCCADALPRVLSRHPDITLTVALAIQARHGEHRGEVVPTANSFLDTRVASRPLLPSVA